MIKITFNNFNDRRKMRGADAARFMVDEDDGEGEELLWMSKKDIKANIRQFPDQKSELEKGLAAYG